MVVLLSVSVTRSIYMQIYIRWPGGGAIVQRSAAGGGAPGGGSRAREMDPKSPRAWGEGRRSISEERVMVWRR